MKKIYYITIFLIVLIVSFLGITYSIEYQDEGVIHFNLIGPSPLYVDVYTTYSEYGIEVSVNGTDVSDKVKIDSSSVNMNKIGKYKVKYEYGGEYIYRDVIVFDKEKPVITLVGGDTIYLLLNGNYQENGYTVIDNYDTDLSDKVVVSGKVDTSKEGEYILKYTVSDNSGNLAEVLRKVIVKKASISIEDGAGNIYNPVSYNKQLYSNTITKNSFYKYGISISGYVKNSSKYYKIKLKNRANRLEYVYNMTTTEDNNYSGNLNLTTVENGLYDAYIISSNSERLINKLDFFSRIIRSKVGNKLVTLSYDNDYVSILVEDFKYSYDVVIDPGHGGTDSGASNGIINESYLNLKVSNYEKCRYEDMGYRVYMIRYDDTYGEMLGSSNYPKLDRRALTIGYYGAVSKVAYSNHHNASYNTSDRGFNILVGNQVNKDDLTPEINIYKRFMNFYNITDDKIRMYSKDYSTSQMFNKLNGEVYDYKNYYAVIRIPYELFNVKMVLYEPIYMTNPSDFNWYYANNNWIKVSEMKIQEYVKYMGGVYNSNNKKCL